MLVEKLIEALAKPPKGTDVCVFDWRKNMRDDSGDGSSAGVYPDFEVSLVSLEPDEAEYYKEKHDKEFTPWIEISFANDDYDDDGTLVANHDQINH